MRILHTSDWHLGRQFHGVSLLEDQRHILEQVIAAIREQAVDVLVIAGDIYDRAVPPTEAIELLDAAVDDLGRDDGGLSGRLRINAPEAFGRLHAHDAADLAR